MSPEHCEKCGTDHDGWPPDSFGAVRACLQARIEALGAGHLLDQLDAVERDIAERRDAALARHFASLEEEQ